MEKCRWHIRGKGGEARANGKKAGESSGQIIRRAVAKSLGVCNALGFGRNFHPNTQIRDEVLVFAVTRFLIRLPQQKGRTVEKEIMFRGFPTLVFAITREQPRTIGGV